MKTKTSLIQLLVLCLFIVAHTARADTTVVLQPGPTDGKDARISRGPDEEISQAFNNHGAEEVLTAGQTGATGQYERFLIQFDLSAIPAQAIVESANLVFTGTGGTNVDVEGYRLKLEWDEGDGTGQTGSVSWETRKVGVVWPDSDLNYPYRNGSAGAYNANAAETNSPIFTGTLKAAGTTTFTLDPNKVQGWIDGRLPNLGLLVRAPGEVTPNKAVSVASSEAANAATRPMLTIVYRFGPTITAVSATSGPIGTPVTITGTNFDPVPANNVVSFGSIRANVSNATATSLTVTVPPGTTSSRISVATGGLTATTVKPFAVTFTSALRIDESSVAPKFDTPFLGQRSSRVADIDGDGRPDLVIIDTNSRVLVYRNIGASGAIDGTTFATPVAIDTHADGQIVVGDFDGDGRQDIFCVGTAGVMLRNTSTPGAITFDAQPSPQDFGGPYSVLAEDLDGDGRLDLVFLYYYESYIQILKNVTVAGQPITFDTRQERLVDAYYSGLAIGDLDGDGRPEIVLATAGGDRQNLIVLPNTTVGGAIGFGTRLRLLNNLDSGVVTLGDVDGDGRLDVVVGSQANNVGQATEAISVFRNTTSAPGAFTFAAKVDVAPAARPNDLALIDVDGDGALDLVASTYPPNLNTGLIALFRNRSAPGIILLDDRIDYPGYGSISASDIDVDGKPDLVLTNSGTQILRNTSTPRPAVGSLSRTSGVAGSTLTITGELFSPNPADNVVYFGAVRALVTEATANRLTVVIPAGATYGPVTVTVGGLTGVSPQPFVPKFISAQRIDSSSFATRRDFTVGSAPNRQAVGDFDGDGKPDLVLANGTDGTISILQNTSPAGSISVGSLAAAVNFTVSSPVRGIRVADVDGDGKLDLIVIGGSSASVLRNLTAGPGILNVNAFAAPVVVADALLNPADLAVGDLDNDGRPDVIVTDADTYTIVGVRNSSSSGVIHFAPAQTFGTYFGPIAVALGDIDGDGLLDVAVTHSQGSEVRIFKNTSFKGQINLVAAQDFGGLSTSYGIALADVDGDGKADLAVTNSGNASVSLYRSLATRGVINNGTFIEQVNFATAPNPQRLAFGDLDGDGRLDLAIVCAGTPGSLSLYRNTATPGTLSTASLGARTDLSAGNLPADIGLADLDADGKPELIVPLAPLAGTGVAGLFKNNVPIVSGPVFQFSGAFTTANEADGQVTLTVERNFTAAASVQYATAEGTAKAGADFTTASGTLAFAAGETSKSFVLSLTDDDTFERDEVFTVALSAPSIGSVGTPGTATVLIADDDFFGATDSVTDIVAPSAPPAAGGSLTIGFTPAGVDGQWRLLGEPFWRNGGDTLSGLVSDNFVVEYKPVPGFLQPLTETVPIGGTAVDLTRAYTDAGAAQVLGSLSVTIKPDDVANAADPAVRGQWRRQGESDWHNSGETLANLNAGSYFVEFKDVPGRTTPAAQSVVVSGNAIATVSRTYFIADAQAGTPPSALSASTAQQAAPYYYSGQIQSDAGFGSGFVVRDRTVLTAAHVLFDDSTLSAATGVLWALQKSRGEFEAPRQVPRGFYVFSGYATQRTADNSPGTSTPASQQLDVAAMYFLEPAGRGGFGGFLRSDENDNEWLLSHRGKLLIGYPVDGVPENDRGRMHATPPTDISFTQVYTNGRVYATTDIRSYGGNSGGPLCVQFDNGNYYPAGVYLGGTAQTLVRAIDSQVVDLINRAQDAGNSGSNNTSGGVMQSNLPLGTLSFMVGSLKVNLSPAAALAAGAQWRVVGESQFRNSGLERPGLAAASYTIEFADAEGFKKPNKITVQVGFGQAQVVNAKYSPDNVPSITSPLAATAYLGEAFNYEITAAHDPDSFNASGLPAGITRTGAVLSGTPTQEGTFLVNLSAKNAVGISGAVFRLKVLGQPGELTVNVAGAGSLSAGYLGVSQRVVGRSYTVKATPAPGFVFDGFTGGLTSPKTKFTFTMVQGLELTANFIPSPFLPLAGEYLGLRVGATAKDAIPFTLTMMRTGGFTANLNVAGKPLSLKGNFDNRGDFSGPVPASAVTLALHFDTVNNTGQLAVTVIAGGAGIPFVANRAVFDARTNPAPMAGRYTAALSRPGGASVPEGDGYGTAVVDLAGKVTFKGFLGDGTKVSSSARVTQDNVWPFFIPLQSHKSAITGKITFRDQPGTSDFDGSLQWSEVAASSRAAFDALVPMLGSTYAAPPVDYASATATIGGAGLAAFQKPFTITGPAFTVRGGTGFALVFNRATGLYSGKFIEPSTTKMRSFNGALFQKTRTGAGYFKGTAGQTGFVELSQ